MARGKLKIREGWTPGAGLKYGGSRTDLGNSVTSPIKPPRQPTAGVPGQTAGPLRARGRAGAPGQIKKGPWTAPNGNAGINPGPRPRPKSRVPGGTVGIEPWLMGKGSKKRGF